MEPSVTLAITTLVHENKTKQYKTKYQLRKKENSLWLLLFRCPTVYDASVAV
jgi:hypothetical protein